MTGQDASRAEGEFFAGRFGSRSNAARRPLTRAEEMRALRMAAIRERTIEETVNDLVRHSRE